MVKISFKELNQLLDFIETKELKPQLALSLYNMELNINKEFAEELLEQVLNEADARFLALQKFLLNVKRSK